MSSAFEPACPEMFENSTGSVTPARFIHIIHMVILHIVTHCRYGKIVHKSIMEEETICLMPKLIN